MSDQLYIYICISAAISLSFAVWSVSCIYLGFWLAWRAYIKQPPKMPELTTDKLSVSAEPMHGDPIKIEKMFQT